MQYHFQLPNAATGQFVTFDQSLDASAAVVILTCNHCPYAVAYEERLVQLAASLAGQGIPLLAISSNDAKQYPQDSFENMKVRAEAKGFNFPYLYDESQEIAKAYGAQRTPHAFVLERKGANWKLAYQGSIDDNYQDAQAITRRYISEVIDQILDGKSERLDHTPSVGCSIKWKG